MYSSILELPTQVRMSLDEDDQKVWMDAYNVLSQVATRDSVLDCAREPSRQSTTLFIKLAKDAEFEA